MDRGLHGGGINGGVIAFVPSQKEFHKMTLAFETYDPPNNSGGEQDFISQYFGLQEQIGTLDVALIFKCTNCH